MLIQQSNGQTDFDETVLTKDGKNYMIVKKTNDPDVLRKGMNHELTHLVMDNVINSNEGVKDLLINLFNTIKTKRPSDQYVKDSLSRLKKDPRPTEIYAWIYGDQKVYDWVKSLNTLQFKEILDIVGETPKGKLRNTT